MATIQDVADLAGVSTATVSRALAGKPTVSPKTRDRVVRAASELGYVVSASASSLASGRHRNIGVVMPNLGNWFFMSVLNGAQAALTQAGYDTTLYHLETDPHEGYPDVDNPRRKRLFEEFLRRNRVDGLIAVSLELDSTELTMLRELGKPMVGLGGPLPDVHTLSIDNREVATLATEHLIGLGHQEIGHIAGSMDFELDFHLPTQRQEGYEQALTAAGIDVNPLLTRAADFTMSGGYDAALQLLGDPRIRPTAVFAASDEMAIGTLLAAKDLGLDVPHDLSVIGIDGHDLAEFFGLTTITQFPEVQGRLAATALLHELDGDEHQPGNEELPYELVVRRSTSSARPTAEK